MLKLQSQVRTGLELNHSLCRNLENLTGTGVLACACRTLCRSKCTKTNESNLIACLYSICNCICCCVQSLGSISLCQAGFSGNGINQICLVHNISY